MKTDSEDIYLMEYITEYVCLNFSRKIENYNVHSWKYPVKQKLGKDIEERTKKSRVLEVTIDNRPVLQVVLVIEEPSDYNNFDEKVNGRLLYLISSDLSSGDLVRMNLIEFTSDWTSISLLDFGSGVLTSTVGCRPTTELGCNQK